MEHEEFATDRDHLHIDTERGLLRDVSNDGHAKTPQSNPSKTSLGI